MMEPDPLSTTTQAKRSASRCAASSRSLWMSAVLQPSSRAASSGWGVRTVGWAASRWRKACCSAGCAATAFRPSASITNCRLRARISGMSASMLWPPPQPATTWRFSRSSCAHCLCIRSGGTGHEASPCKFRMTRPAPACKAALAAKTAAPLMPMPRKDSDSPPMTATSPWLPLWLACDLCIRSAGLLSHAAWTGRFSVVGVLGMSSSSVLSQISPHTSRPWPMKRPGLAEMKVRVWSARTTPCACSAPSSCPDSGFRPVGKSSARIWAWDRFISSTQD